MAPASRAKRTALVMIIAAWMAQLLWCVVALTMCAAPAAAQIVPPQAAAHRHTLTRAAHSQWGLDAPLAALAAQVHQESRWQAQAVSRVGARGMAQFMPATATWWCGREGTASAECLPHNPVWALRAMVGYDRHLFDLAPARYTPSERLWVALRAYNGGMGHWHAEARATGQAMPSRESVDKACGQARRAALHCAENLGYPRRILIELQPLYASWGPTWALP